MFVELLWNCWCRYHLFLEYIQYLTEVGHYCCKDYRIRQSLRRLFGVHLSINKRSRRASLCVFSSQFSNSTGEQKASASRLNREKPKRNSHYKWSSFRLCIIADTGMRNKKRVECVADQTMNTTRASFFETQGHQMLTNDPYVVGL